MPTMLVTRVGLLPLLAGITPVSPKVPHCWIAFAVDVRA